MKLSYRRETERRHMSGKILLTAYKLSTSTDKTKKLFYFFAAMLPETSVFRLLCQELKRVKQATLLGIDVKDTLSTAAYVDRLLMQVNQRLYLLSLLQSSGLQRSSLHLLFNDIVINKLTYAGVCWYAGQLTADDKTG